MERLRVHLSRNGRSEFLSALTANAIEFTERQPTPGMVLASSGTVEIIAAVGTLPFASLAVVLIKWLHGRASRSVTVQTRGNTVVQLKGYSADEAGKLLKEAASLIVVQTAKDDD